MKTFLTTTALGVFGAVMLAGAAIADTHSVVRATSGEVVKSIAFQNCVQSNFEGSSECGSAITSDMLTVYFDFDSAVLTPAAKAKLDVAASKLKAEAVEAVHIVGYADEIGNATYNQSLSLRRANAVATYLRSVGVAVISGNEVRGLGETSSRSACKGVRGAKLKACLWRDRRVEIELVK